MVHVGIVAQLFRKPVTERRMRTGYSQAENYFFTSLLPEQFWTYSLERITYTNQPFVRASEKH